MVKRHLVLSFRLERGGENPTVSYSEVSHFGIPRCTETVDTETSVSVSNKNNLPLVKVYDSYVGRGSEKSSKVIITCRRSC